MTKKTIFGNEGLRCEVCKTKRGDGKGHTINGVSLLLSRGGQVIVKDGELWDISLDKDDAVDFGIQLIMAGSCAIPDRGYTIDSYQDFSVSLHPTYNENGNPTGEPVLCVGDIDPEDMRENGIAIGLTKDSARSLIRALASVVCPISFTDKSERKRK